MKVLGSPIVATDLSDLGKLMYLDGAGPVHGLLGHELLRRHAAVIDYPAETLYLKSPWAVEGPKLAGKWQCVTAESEGQAAPPDLVQSLRVDLEDGVLNYHDDQAARRFVVGCDPLQRLKQMDWYLTSQPGDGPLPGKYPGIYTVTADELLICICLDCTKGGERPTGFATKSGTGHSLFKFRRVR